MRWSAWASGVGRRVESAMVGTKTDWPRKGNRSRCPASAQMLANDRGGHFGELEVELVSHLLHHRQPGFLPERG